MKKFLFLLSLFTAAPAMAWTLKASGANCGGGSTNAIVNINTTGADFIACAVTAYDFIPAGNITDSIGSSSNTYTCKTGQFTPSQAGTKICYAWNAVVGNDTITYNNAGSEFASMSCVAFSGSKTSADPFDTQSGTGYSALTSTAPGSMSPSGSNDLFLGAIAGEGSPLDSATVSGWTLGARQVFSIGFCESSQIWYLSPGNSSSQNPVFSWSSSASGGVVGAAFLGGAIANASSGLFFGSQ